MSQILQEQEEISSQPNKKDLNVAATQYLNNKSTVQQFQLDQSMNQKIQTRSPVYQANKQSEQIISQQNQAKNMQKIQLICEDRNTQKKCCFPSLQIELQKASDKINAYHLLNSSLSVKSFLKGHLIFVEQEGMDVALGLFPFEMDQSYDLSLTQMGEKFSAKIQHQYVQTESNSEVNYQKSSTSFSEKQALGNELNKQNKKKELESQIVQEQGNIDIQHEIKQEFTSSQRKISSSFSSNHNNNSPYSSEVNSHQLQEDMSELIEDTDQDLEEECQDDLVNIAKIKRNRVSNTTCSGESDRQKKSESKKATHVNIEDGKYEYDLGEEEIDYEGSASSQSKSSQLIKKKIQKEKNLVFRPKSYEIKKNADNLGTHHAIIYQQAPKKRRRQTLNKRSHERTIREGIQLVTEWRNSHEYFKSKNQVKDLQEVAQDMGISKKTLDYYYLELRTAEFFNFDFDQHLNQRMGFLRQFIEDETKKFQDSSKQAKIPRQLNFKYKLPEHREINSNTVPSQLINKNNNNTNCEYNQNQQNGQIYFPIESFSSQNQQIMFPHSNYSHQSHLPYSNINPLQSQKQTHFSSQPKSNNQSISPFINQKQKFNQILLQQQQINAQSSNNNHNSQVDANSTSSISILNQINHNNNDHKNNESCLNQSQQNSQSILQHFQSQQPTQIFNIYPQETKNNNEGFDHIPNQIIDYQAYNNQNYQDFTLQSNSTHVEDSKSMMLQYSEQQSNSALGDQQNKSLLNFQQSNTNRFLSQQNQMVSLPSTHSLTESIPHQHNYPQNQQQTHKQNPEFLHPYELKQQNEGYKIFLEKQMKMKLQEQLSDDCIMQQMFE